MIPETFNPHLADLVEAEIERGNTIARVDEAPSVTVALAQTISPETLEACALPTSVKLKEHDDHLEIACRFSRQRVLAPKVAVLDLSGLSNVLVGVAERERERGNEIAQVEHDARSGKFCVRFIEPVDTRSLPEGTEAWTNWDPHYPIEAGVRCPKTGHWVSGPPPVVKKLKPAVAQLIESLAEDREEVWLARGLVAPQVPLKSALEGHALVALPARAYVEGDPTQSVFVRRERPVRGREQYSIELILWTRKADGLVGKGPLTLRLIASERAARLDIEVVSIL